MEGLDETVGFAALGRVRPNDEPTDTDLFVDLDDIEGDLARGGDGDLEWSQHHWSRLDLNEFLQVLDQFASPLWRGEPAEPSVAEASRPGKCCLRVASNHDRRVRILYWCRELNNPMVHSAILTRSWPCPEVSHPSQAILGSTSPFRHGDTEGGQLRFDMAHADAQDQAPLR
jgi:hypothetical protein